MSTNAEYDEIQDAINFQRAVEEIELANEGNRVCPSCEREVPEEELRVRMDPFEIKIHNRLKPLYSCGDCYDEVELDI